MITIISSTNRKNSNTSKLAKFVHEQILQKSDNVSFLSLENLPHDFIFSAFNGLQNGLFNSLIEKHIVPAQKFIFVLPEYNGSYPGILKSFVDCIPPRFFHQKNAALIGCADGHAGALRAVDSFALVLNHIKVNVHWNRPKLSDISSKFIPDLDAHYQKRIIDLISEFIQ